MKTVAIIIACVMAIFTTSVDAHGGKTDKHGCHKDKKTGKRHCH